MVFIRIVEIVWIFSDFCKTFENAILLNVFVERFECVGALIWMSVCCIHSLIIVRWLFDNLIRQRVGECASRMAFIDNFISI